MDIRVLSPAYAVAPQIDPGDLAEIAAQGFGTIIDNRPDAEIPTSHQAEAMQAAAAAAGLTFVANPVTHQSLNMDMVTLQRTTLDQSEKPVLAYCASGTRSTIVWALGQARDLPSAQIISAAADAGYDISGLQSQLDQLFNG